jgi:FKBP-type peptidyl-prolyl cis-trans isomerase SlpA
MVTRKDSIQPGSRVRLHLEILLADGTEALSSFGGEAMELTMGDGTLAPGIEGLLIGLQAGADARILADGSELYGPHEEGNIHWLPRSDFPAGLDPSPGQLVAFETPGGLEIAGVLLEGKADLVRVDFNHPLSGHSLQIRAQVLAVADPSGSATASLGS